MAHVWHTVCHNLALEKGVTGTNVAAALFFLPAMLVTYDNANDAIEAAKERKKYLYDLAEDKGCDI